MGYRRLMWKLSDHYVSHALCVLCKQLPKCYTSKYKKGDYLMAMNNTAKSTFKLQPEFQYVTMSKQHDYLTS